MKKVGILIVILIFVSILPGCGEMNSDSIQEEDASKKQDKTEITMWTYPVGNFVNPTSMKGILSSFHKAHPDINVSVEYLTYDNGDDKIEQALLDGNAPDLVLEGPERLVASWGERGLMVDLSDLWDTEKADSIYKNVKEACQHSNGAYYGFPICMTAHCMAINYDMFRDAGALSYIDEKNHTWTTEGFIKAVKALYANGQKCAGVVYCMNQSGDQGTRALVNNLYGGSFTNDGHTAYTIDSEENKKALELLYNLDGILFDPTIASADAIDLFCNKKAAMVFCWNVSIEIQQTIKNSNLDFEVFPMAFPAYNGQPKLQGGIWGFGIFDNKDDKKIEAAKTFIQFMTENDTQYKRTVQTSTYWPVRDLENIYVNDKLMTEYSIFTPFVGDYYQITPGWPTARAAWWKMLQEIGDGKNVEEAVKEFPERPE